ncbi:MAG: hypothetical protein D4R43_02895 [Sphingobacteriales bacterium]|nr:MAG: hypothetical protein D4R43_02895 [Sphingobacteriales bacterium]
MSVISLSSIYENIIGRIEKFTSSNYWKLKSLLALTFLSLCFASPQFSGYEKTFNEIKGWQAFHQQREHPFTPLNFNEASNAAKRTFRLTVPILAFAFHLNDYAIIALEWLVNILLIYFSLLLFEKITKDKTLALFGTIAFTFIYIGHSGFTDNNAWFDVVAYLFLLLAMLYSNIFLIFTFTFLAGWTDERAVVASLLIFLWWKFNEIKTNDFSFSSFFTFEKKSNAVLLALLCYSVIRFLVSIFFDLHTPDKGIGLEVILNSFRAIPLGLFASLEGFWLLLVVCFIFLFKQKKYSITLSLLAMMFATLLIAFSVEDITRSAGYLFPVIFISNSILNEKISQNELRKFLFACALVCFLFPSYYYASHDHILVWYKPFFIKAFEIFNRLV